MSDNITLPRAVVTHMRLKLHALVREADSDCGDSDCEECESLRPIRAAITVLDAALAEPEPEPEPDAIARAVEAEREAICELADNMLWTSNALPLIAAIRARGSK